MAAKRKNKWAVWLMALAVIGGTAFGINQYRNVRNGTTTGYKTSPVTRGDVVNAVTANGSLGAVKSVEVGSQISGIIKEIRVDYNARVQAGEVIAQIDPSTYERAVDEADAQLAGAKAALELAQSNYRRSTELRTNDLISESALDEVVAALHQGEATLRIREAALKRAQVDLERTTIYAPISGVVISRSVEEGQTVAASFSTPTLFIIANDLAKMQIEAMVSEADVGEVAENQEVTFTVDAYPGREFHGVVKQVRYEATSSQNVVTYTTIIDVNNADLKLLPGMTATASIISAQSRNTLKIPNAALRFRPALDKNTPKPTNAPAGGPPGRIVFVLAKADGSDTSAATLRPVSIRTGITDGSYTEVIDGLNEGDVVVTGTATGKETTATTAATTTANNSPFNSSGSPPPGGGPPPPH